jgi:hypothetical protein
LISRIQREQRIILDQKYDHAEERAFQVAVSCIQSISV